MIDKEKLVELLAKYFTVGDSYAYNLTRVKSAFAVGTVTIDDFVEFDDEVIADIADHLLAHGVTVQDGEDDNVPTKWIPASEPPTEYRDDYGELIPFLVCLEGTEYPFRAMYDGKVWGDGWGAIPVTYWMPLPQPPKGE